MSLLKRGIALGLASVVVATSSPYISNNMAGNVIVKAYTDLNITDVVSSYVSEPGTYSCNYDETFQIGVNLKKEILKNAIDLKYILRIKEPGESESNIIGTQVDSPSTKIHIDPTSDGAEYFYSISWHDANGEYYGTETPRWKISIKDPEYKLSKPEIKVFNKTKNAYLNSGDTVLKTDVLNIEIPCVKLSETPYTNIFVGSTYEDPENLIGVGFKSRDYRDINKEKNIYTYTFSDLAEGKLYFVSFYKYSNSKFGGASLDSTYCNSEYSFKTESTYFSLNVVDNTTTTTAPTVAPTTPTPATTTTAPTVAPTTPTPATTTTAPTVAPTTPTPATTTTAPTVTPTTVTVVYNANEGTFNGSSTLTKTLTSGSTEVITSSQFPTREGYTFVGYISSASGTILCDKDANICMYTVPNCNATLVALWEKNTTPVITNSPIVPTQTPVVTVTPTASAIVSTPVVPTTTAIVPTASAVVTNSPIVPTQTPVETTTVPTSTPEQKVNITIYANGGTFASGQENLAESYTVGSTQLLDNVHIPTREGYVFDGFTTLYGTIIYTNNVYFYQVPGCDDIISAKWKLIEKETEEETEKDNTEIMITTPSFKLGVGDSGKILATASKGKITYSSSNSKIVTVSSTGKITAKKAGSATITLKAGETSKKVKVTVKKAPTTATIKLNVNKNKTLKKGKSFTLKVSFLKNTYAKGVSFKSSNKKVVTVTNKGKLTAKNKGKCKITVTTSTGAKKVITVTVK